MRNVPGYPTDTNVLEPAVRVVHGGVERDVENLSLSRELPSSFHEQVRGISGITQATGSVDWSLLSEVVESHPTAFNRVGEWPPRPRDLVDVYTGVRIASGELLAKQLTGFVSKSGGEPTEGVASGLVDRIARLSRKVTLPPLLTNMPPLIDGGPWRGVGLYPTFFTDLAARAGSFCSTPPMPAGSAFSAPLMGSAWPERGILTTGLRFSDRANANARWQETPWGMGVSDAYLVYSPSGVSTLNRPMEITAMAPAAPYVGRSYVAALWGASEIRLNFNNSSVYGMVNGSVIVEMGYVAGNAFTLRVVPGGGSMVLTLRDAAGREATATVPIASGSGNPMDEIRVVSEVEGAMIGGAQVAFPATAWTSLNYTRNAYITPAAHSASLSASPPIMDVTAKHLLEEQSTAELAALWIDGDGALRWINRDRLIAGASAATLTSRDHLKSLPWEEDFAGVASQIVVSGRKATVQQSKFNMITMWESGQSGAEPGDTFEWLIHPDSDEDWIMPDLGIETLGIGSANTIDGFNRFGRGRDSWLAVYAENDPMGTNTWVSGSASAAFVDYSTYRVAAMVSSGNSSEADWEYSLKIPSEGVNGVVAGPMRRQPGLGTPVLRGRAKTMWEDMTYTATAGVWDASVLSHDVGWWVQDPAAVQAIANLLAANTTTPRPYLSGVSTVPDARLELGDVVILSDPDITGIQFRCLVVGLDDRFSGSPLRWEQSCNFRVLSTTNL